MFTLYSQGQTVPQLTAMLNAEGTLADRGRSWTAKRIYSILQNRIYCGDITVGRSYLDATGKHHPGNNPVTVNEVHPALVSKETFEKVQQIRSHRSENHALARWESSPYLLSGLVRCGLCGRHMSGTAAKGGNYHYYTCQKYYREGKDACRGIRISKKKLENFVLTRVKEVILDEENLRRLTKMVDEELQKEKQQTQKKLQTVQTQLRALRKRLDRHYEVLETGQLVIGDLAPRIKELCSSIASLEERQIEILESTEGDTNPRVSLETVLSYAKELKKALRLGTFQERKAFLAAIIKEIQVDVESVQIEYRIPTPEQRTKDVLPSVLQSVPSGGGERIRTPYPLATRGSLRCLELGVDLKSFRQAAAIMIRPTAPEKGKRVKTTTMSRGFLLYRKRLSLGLYSVWCILCLKEVVSGQQDSPSASVGGTCLYEPGATEMYACFDERKATQMAAVFLKYAGGKMEYIRLIKLLYITDREALRRWQYPLTGDSYYSLRHGPIVSGIYDLITEDPKFSEPTYWGTHVKTCEYNVSLESDPSTDALAPAEIHLICDIHNNYKNVNTWDLVEMTHDQKEFPEWTDPGVGRIPILCEDILRAVGLNDGEAQQRAAELEDINYFHSVLNCH